MSLPTVAIIGLSVAGVVLLGGGTYLFTRKSKDEDEFADPVGKLVSQKRDNSTYDKNSAGYILGGKKKTIKKRQHSKKKK